MEIKKVDFNTILPIWRDKLWPDRKTKIAPISLIDLTGLFNKSIAEESVQFFACYDKDKVIGVNSLIQTSKLFCRSRGIWVDKKYRNKGIGKSIMKKTINNTKLLNCIYLWSMPRQSSLDFYIKCGFKQISEFFDDYEFGPNCFVIQKI